MPEDIALLGTGIMGAAMARNLLAAGHRVRVWNRTAAKAEALAQDGAVVSKTPGQAARGAGVVLTMLSDGPAVEHAMTGDCGALFELDKDDVWLQMSTVGVAGTEGLAALAKETGVTFVDAPVLGTRAPAEAGELLVLAAGPGRVRDRCAPVFDAIGRDVRWLAERPGAATRLKLVLNSWVLGVVEATAETIALAEALGVEGSAFLESIAGGPLDCAYAQSKGRMMIARELPASFPLAMARKDAGLILEAAAGLDRDLPLMRAVHDQMARAEELGHGDEDMAATIFASSG